MKGWERESHDEQLSSHDCTRRGIGFSVAVRSDEVMGVVSDMEAWSHSVREEGKLISQLHCLMEISYQQMGC